MITLLLLMEFLPFSSEHQFLGFIRAHYRGIGASFPICSTKASSMAWNQWLHSQSERIESTFNEVQNTGRHLEHLLRKTVLGVTTHDACHCQDDQPYAQIFLALWLWH